MEQQAAFFMKYLPLKLSLVSLGTAILPAYLGSTLRGAVGQALHSDLPTYNYLYNNRSLSNGRQDIPNPYLIVPPELNRSEFRPREELCFYIILLGEAARYTQPLVDALQRKRFGLGALRYPFELKKITHDLDQRVIWEDGSFYEAAARSVVLPYRSLPDVKKATLRTCTPLRIRRDGALLETIDFIAIIRNITHRLEAIAERYGGWVDSLEAARIQALSTQVAVTQNHFKLKPITRYSNRLGEKMDFSGLTGGMELQGDLTPFVPWLFAARTLHIGRNTTFGMGRIEVEFI
ncbi:CRISPR system precrRNA processing endoribonuclease RAMP protein Cas6 [Desulfosporosinus sp. PR]|uniref:CRISPR system precrRNA processing endoribonuclease RAMP protein Cas6 n=1 Tax=Candidatus Desulfosporosinus nitrosoreducens TaxID=3401928 RepID=UPI0027F5ACB4|nr:CRISPR system precrRNA processing endoribonuclease RAMP protein Cas6 [Desulfosporosinus sp. PR]MDQ7092060.1 CRISPR system precrRNA processing endoribonuclease RAMP protein Cas6 [Desulfosporosinus sp. PR]